MQNWESHLPSTPVTRRWRDKSGDAVQRRGTLKATHWVSLRAVSSNFHQCLKREGRVENKNWERKPRTSPHLLSYQPSGGAPAKCCSAKCPAKCLGRWRRERLCLLQASVGILQSWFKQMATYLSLFPSTEAAGTGQCKTAGVSKVSCIWFRNIYEYWCLKIWMGLMQRELRALKVR